MRMLVAYYAFWYTQAMTQAPLPPIQPKRRTLPTWFVSLLEGAWRGTLYASA